MEVVPKSSTLQYNLHTFECIKEKYGLNNLKEAIDNLALWIRNQEHFKIKDYPREYLEKILINNDNNAESAKEMIENMCSFKTALPKYYDTFEMHQSDVMKIMHCALLPKMTGDHHRVFMLKNFGQHYNTGIFNFYQYCIMICEYYLTKDYANGIIAIFDYRENNIKELVKAINLVELQQFIAIIMDGYNLRLKIRGIHYLTSSRIIQVFISLLKQALSPKVAECIHVHKDLETLYKYAPVDIMPKDYGGNQKYLKELSDNLKNEINSKEFLTYYNSIKQAQIIESSRSKENNLLKTIMQAKGTFREINFD